MQTDVSRNGRLSVAFRLIDLTADQTNRTTDCTYEYLKTVPSQPLLLTQPKTRPPPRAVGAASVAAAAADFESFLIAPLTQ
jgi:hypothetical protein